MTMDEITFETMRYNPAEEGFETLARLHDNGRSFSYPVRITAPLNAEISLVIRALGQAARAAHLSGQGGLRMVDNGAGSPETAPMRHRQKSLLGRIIEQIAA